MWALLVICLAADPNAQVGQAQLDAYCVDIDGWIGSLTDPDQAKRQQAVALLQAHEDEAVARLEAKLNRESDPLKLPVLAAVLKQLRERRKSFEQSESGRQVARLLEEILSARILRGHDGSATCAAFSERGAVATGGQDHTVRVWDLSGKARLVFAQSSGITSLAFSPDGDALASGSEDGTVSVLDILTLDRRQYKGHTKEVLTLVWTADGKSLLSGSADGTARLWGRTGEIGGKVFSRSTNAVHAVAADDLGRWFVVFAEGELRVIERRRRNKSDYFRTAASRHTSGRVLASTPVKDGALIAVTSTRPVMLEDGKESYVSTISLFSVHQDIVLQESDPPKWTIGELGESFEEQPATDLGAGLFTRQGAVLSYVRIRGRNWGIGDWTVATKSEAALRPMIERSVWLGSCQALGPEGLS